MAQLGSTTVYGDIRIHENADIGGHLKVDGNVNIGGAVTAPSFVGELTGNSSTSSKWKTARTLSLSVSGVSGSASIDGSANASISFSLNTLTRGSYLTGSNYNGGSATTWAVDATSANTAGKVVARDSSGGFAAGAITMAGSLVVGNASTGATISTDGSAELSSLYVRGSLTVDELISNQIRGTNGDIIVSDTAKIKSVNGRVLTIDGMTNDYNPFKVGDVILCQRFKASDKTTVKVYKASVTAVSGLTFTIGSNIEGTTGNPEIGDVIVRFNSTDSNRKGIIHLASSSNGAPFIDTIFDGSVKSRFGRLDGLTDAALGSLSGYGLYADNAFLKGKIVATSGSFTGSITASSGNIGGFSIDSDSIVSANKRIHLSNASSRIVLTKKEQSSVSTGARVQLYYNSEGDWGLYGCSDESGTSPSLQLGSTNQIAGWSFNTSAISKNNVSLGSDGSISNSGRWLLANDGSGNLARNNIVWDVNGNVTFGANVKLQWERPIDDAKELASAMAFGKMLYRDPEFSKGTNGMNIYNNGASTHGPNVRFERVTLTESPNDSDFAIKISNIGESTPGLGGFYFGTMSSSSKIFITKIIAKIPTGYNIEWASNSTGSGGSKKWLTSQSGTGDWKEYICKVTCGSSGSFSTTNYFYIKDGAFGSTATPIVWYLAYATVFDTTANETFTTTIDANGIYTGTLTANQINVTGIDASMITVGTLSADRISTNSLHGNKITAGTIAADRIAANTITSGQINAASIQAAVVTAGAVNGLSCTFTKGSIGGWDIDNKSIFKGNTGLYAGSSIAMASSASGSGSWYLRDYIPTGVSLTWHQGANAGHIVLGDIAASTTTVKTGFMGIQMMDHAGQEYFVLSANTTKSGGSEYYNRIAGWAFNNNTISKGNVSLGADGSIANSGKWLLANDGSGNIACNKIRWNTVGDVTFDSSVKLQWEQYTNSVVGGLNSGNRNVLKNSGTEITNGSYNTANYDTTITLLPSTKYTIVVNCKTTGGQKIGVWLNSGSNNVGYASVNSDGVSVIKFTSPSTITAPTRISLYNYPSTGSVANPATVRWITMYGGDVVPSLEWIAAPEDKPLTYIDANGIYTGTLTANQINVTGINASMITVGTLSADRISTNSLHGNKITAGTIASDRIVANTITSGQINAASIQAAVVTAGAVNGLSCTFEQGSIGGWGIGNKMISKVTMPNGVGRSISIASEASGSGTWYSRNYVPSGLSMTWHQNSNAGHIVFGDIAASGASVKTGFMGIQMMDHVGQEFFCLSTNTLKSGGEEYYNRIAGWAFNNNTISKGNVFLGSDGTIGNEGKWMLRNNGSGYLASTNISWDEGGNVTFDDKVKLHWRNDIDKIQVGVRNLILKPSLENGWIFEGDWKSDGYVISSINTPSYTALRSNLIPITKNQEFVVSFTSDSFFSNFNIQAIYHNSAKEQIGSELQVVYVSQRGIYKYKVHDDDNIKYVRLVWFYSSNSTGTTRVLNPKLEFGNKVTDYTVAPEDNPLTYIDANGIYTGTLTANQVNALECTFERGTVGGWRMGSTLLSSNNMRIDSTKGINFNNNFIVDENGNITANNGRFTGHIEGTSGVIGGFIIGDGNLSSSVDDISSIRITSNPLNFTSVPHKNTVTLRLEAAGYDRRLSTVLTQVATATGNDSVVTMDNLRVNIESKFKTYIYVMHGSGASNSNMRVDYSIDFRGIITVIDSSNRTKLTRALKNLSAPRKSSFYEDYTVGVPKVKEIIDRSDVLLTLEDKPFVKLEKTDTVFIEIVPHVTITGNSAPSSWYIQQYIESSLIRNVSEVSTLVQFTSVNKFIEIGSNGIHTKSAGVGEFKLRNTGSDVVLGFNGTHEKTSSIPELLFCGTMMHNTTFTRQRGVLRDKIKARYVRVGVYAVEHNLGHNNYVVSATISIPVWGDWVGNYANNTLIIVRYDSGNGFEIFTSDGKGGGENVDAIDIMIFGC